MRKNSRISPGHKISNQAKLKIDKVTPFVESIQRGIEFQNSGDLESAKVIYEDILSLNPDNLDALVLLGALFIQIQNWERAVQCLSAACNKGLKNPFVFGNLGFALQELKQYEKALEFLNQAIEMNPDYALAHNNKGTALKELWRLDEALGSYNAALRLDSQNAGIYRNKGRVLHELNQFEQALNCFNWATLLDPSCADAHSNKGVVLQEQGDISSAISAFEKAIYINTEHVDAFYNKSLTLLLSGDYENGFALYEWRLKLVQIIQQALKCQKLDRDHIHSTILKDKKILVYAEQGLGDTLQFCRYLPVLKKFGPHITFVVQKSLIDLLQCVNEIDDLNFEIDLNKKFDFHSPLMSLPWILRADLSSIPAPKSYIFPDPEKVSFWDKQLGFKSRPRVGLVWSGGFRADQPNIWSVNQRRNMPIENLIDLSGFQIDFYSLQKGEPAESEFKKMVDAGWSGPLIRDYTMKLNTFSDTAALIEHLDLIISVDTSTAHLAAAMGKPVWLLNRKDTCWRWLLDRSDSPWYPTMTIFRQTKGGDWSDVMQMVKDRLKTTFK